MAKPRTGADAPPAPDQDELVALAREIYVRTITGPAGASGAKTAEYLASDALDKAQAFQTAAARHLERTT